MNAAATGGVDLSATGGATGVSSVGSLGADELPAGSLDPSTIGAESELIGSETASLLDDEAALDE